jgi:hypothetical protein
MKKLTRHDLFSLEQYAERREVMRGEIIAHKQNRNVALGEHVRLLFEDRQTMHYQIQEMLRAERVFEAAGIQEELDSYNPLIPDGDNLKATMQIEYEDVAERQTALIKLRGIEDKVWAKIGGQTVYAIPDEDIERANETKTASVHFLRFQFDRDLIAKLRDGAELSFGIDHPQYQSSTVITAAQRQALLVDFD